MSGVVAHDAPLSSLKIPGGYSGNTQQNTCTAAGSHSRAESTQSPGERTGQQALRVRVETTDGYIVPAALNRHKPRPWRVSATVGFCQRSCAFVVDAPKHNQSVMDILWSRARSSASVLQAALTAAISSERKKEERRESVHLEKTSINTESVQWKSRDRTATGGAPVPPESRRSDPHELS
ncbi:hypothetical protein INR49_003599 [Caranx melampygus]|nr:hypothetical protein INR49_003599 [Caranx melampygus]